MFKKKSKKKSIIGLPGIKPIIPIARTKSDKKDMKLQKKLDKKTYMIENKLLKKMLKRRNYELLFAVLLIIITVAMLFMDKYLAKKAAEAAKLKEENDPDNIDIIIDVESDENTEEA